MPSTISRQSQALVRRYFISLYRKPISSIFRSLVWPGFLIGLAIYLLNNITSSGDDDYKKQVNLAFGIPMFTSFITIFQVYHFSEWLVADRATGVKSLMISMGLKRSSYYIGNSISFLAFSLPTVMIICTLTLMYIFVDTQASIVAIILVFLLFNIHLTGLLFVIASFITSSTYVAIVGLILILEMNLHSLILFIMGKSSAAFQPLVLFFASMSPYESIRILCDSYRLCKNCGTTELSKDIVSQPTYLILIAMTFWSIFAFTFARWFEEVCPWQRDSAVRHPFFCCGTNSKPYQSSEEESPQNSRYFEQTIANRDVGIRINNLTKIFRNIPVVNNISFNIYKGETTLLLGHNGAGKTTLMDMILGKLDPDNGRVFLTDSHRRISNSREGVGVCPQTSILDDNLSVKQHLELFADIKTSAMSSSMLRSHIKTTIADVSLTSHMDKLPSELSGGMKRKLSLAMAFVGNSGILILDEPSSGLDPDSRVFVWNAIRRYRGDRTVLLSTQHMEEADYLGDRIAIMSEGRIICCGSTTFLNRIYGNGYKLRVECRASKKKQVLGFVRKYFETAKTSENVQMVTPPSRQSKSDPIQDVVFELTDDKTKDLELNLIRMLEDIENNSNALHIKSHGLKSSSIEDVLLNTTKAAQQHEPSETVQLKLTSTSGHIATLSEPLRSPNNSFMASQKSFLYALLMKHIHSYRKDWLSIATYRLIIPAISLYLIVGDLVTPIPGYKPSFYATLLVFHYVFNPTMERTTKFKTMQLTSHANFVVYWLSQLLIDSISFIILAIGINLFLEMTFKGIFLKSLFSVHSIATLSIFLTGLSSALVAYILSMMLSDTKTCNGTFLILNLVSSVADLLVTIIGLAISTNLEWLKKIIDTIFVAISPLDSFQFILYGLRAECYIGTSWNLDQKCVESESFSPISQGFIALVAQILFYSFLLYFIEKLNLDLTWYLRWKNIFQTKYKLFTGGMREIDEDVMNESSKATRLVTGYIPYETYSMVASDISKSYIAGMKVVDHLSFTVNRGECFGLLGVNGAGKSTTFAMLVAELKPDSGKIWVNGHYNSSDVTNYRQGLGYDPQSNPEMSLSSVDALFLMARLRMVHEPSIQMMVSSILELLSMTEHAYKPVKDLSGGTKRKLALGMSLIGSPALLALDEPTAGVDPIARRSIWQLLRSLRMQNGASIVISSHAMEECEAICDRISIMARGRLRCIGSFLSLRSKFSQGCSIRVHFSGQLNGPNVVDETKKLISHINERLHAELGSSVKLSDTNVNSATFNISDDSVKRSKLFKILRDLGQKYQQMSYMVNDSSLEDIFIALAKEQQEFEQNISTPAT